LVSFYDITNGGQWKDRRGWLEGKNPCERHGLKCDGGHVISISLHYNNLRRTLPNSLIELPRLRSLSLYYNQLGGNIPTEYGQLKSLEVLILHNNELEGSIPPELGNLTQLNMLSLYGNDLTGSVPPELRGIPTSAIDLFGWGDD